MESIARVKSLEEENEGLERKLQGMVELERKNAELEKKIKTMEEKWERLKEDVVKETIGRVTDSIREDMNKMKEELEVSLGVHVGRTRTDIIKGLGEDIVKEATTRVKVNIEKDQEEEKRKNNLVLYVVPESNREIAMEREREDEQRCQYIFKEVLGVSKERYNIVKTVRLGQRKENGRYRPLLVKFNNEREKWNILSQSKRMKDAVREDVRKIRLAKDMTFEEREREKELRDLLWEKRNQGDDSWQIKNGDLVKKVAQVERQAVGGVRPKE